MPMTYEGNPKFHPSALRRGPHSERLYRGRMSDFFRPGVNSSTRRVVYFLYNPTILNFGYTMNPEIMNEMNLPQSELGEGIAQQTFGFTLVFNRIYEVAYQNNKKGVLMDIEAMEAMTQFTSDSPAMRYVPLKFNFGVNWAMEGVIQSANVQYQLFSQEMIPTHCEVTLQMFRVHSIHHGGFDRQQLEQANQARYNRITGVPNAPAGFLDRLGN